uniref:Uncharacterized protein n=1 Tax=Macaca nemestrina TaxID=9545 RepID=A0A2K6B5Z2_MACNE
MQAAARTGGAAGDADGPGACAILVAQGAMLAVQERRVLRAALRASAAARASPEGCLRARRRRPRGPRGGPASRLNGCCRAGPGGRNSLLEFYLTMPFPTPMEAELAHRSLARDAPPLPMPGVLLKEFTVSGNILTIRLIAADHRQLQLSISSCLQQLSLLMWITQCFLPVFLARPPSGQRR